jgi:hypothetical protein
MSVATGLLNGFAAGIIQLYPTAKVKTRRSTDKNPLYTPGDSLPLFVVVCNEPEKTEGATAVTVFKKYRVTVNYLTRELPNQRDESTYVRDKREALARKFDGIALSGVPEVNQIDPDPQQPYTLPVADQTVSVSPVAFDVETKEPRN